jgi:selenide,water dikinase
MGGEEMACGGCAAKLGASPLERALARLDAPPRDDSVLLGLAQPDDAAALALPGGAVSLTTIDAFRAFSDDPWLVGRVAAVNAASDVFAKGGQPRHALALVTVPAGRGSEETLYQVLAGVRAAFDPLGVSLVGGHTTVGEELFVGISVSGDLAAAGDLLRIDALRPGDHLVLSKALGTGVLLAADMRGLARGAWLEGALASMLRPNAAALRAARDGGARACTDVSGFGLAGHLAPLLRASVASARLTLDALPALDGALALLAGGLRSTFHEQNAELRSALVSAPELAEDPAFDLLFDPQTSGGLLFSVPASRSADTVLALHGSGDARAAVIGEVLDSRGDGALVEVLRR